MAKIKYPVLMSPPARLMWAHLTTPKVNKRGKSHFQCDLVFPVSALASPEFAAMKALAQRAATDEFGDRLPGLIAAEKIINPFWKHERKVDAETGKLPPGYEPGGIYITIKSDHRPGLFLPAPSGGVQPMLDASDMYPGCWVVASMDCWSYDNESKGVSFGLRGLVKVKDDTPTGGRGNVAGDFAGIAAPPATAAAGTPATAASLFL